MQRMLLMRDLPHTPLQRMLLHTI